MKPRLGSGQSGQLERTHCLAKLENLSCLQASYLSYALIEGCWMHFKEQPSGASRYR
jgi:hypothetical protein